MDFAIYCYFIKDLNENTYATHPLNKYEFEKRSITLGDLRNALCYLYLVYTKHV